MRTDENDIMEPRYKLAQSEAVSTWETLGEKKIPIQLNDIVKAMGINTMEVDLPVNIRSDGISQMDSNGNCIIMYRKDISVERKRFTVAHELGHVILEHISFDGSTSQKFVDSQEKEANAFAGALLIPPKDIKAFMKNGDRTIDDVITRYWVSKEVASIAISVNKLINVIKIN